MIIRAAEDADYPAIRDPVADRGDQLDHGVAVGAQLLDQPSLVRAWESGEQDIVGHILFSPMQTPFRAVAPDRQRRGFGSALIDAGHELAREQDWQGIFVVGEPDYYRRFGYETALAAGFASPYAGSHFMALAPDGALPAITGEVRHARAFAALA